MDVPDSITCVDCGEKAHLLSHPPEDGWEAGDIVAYRCKGCNDRWDLVVEAESETEGRHYYAAEAQRILEERRGDGV